MCTYKSTCHCHLLKPAIQQDKEERFKAYFDKNYLTELYDFLKFAYEITPDSANFADDLASLKKDYVLEGSENSINVQKDRVRKQFLTAYDEYYEGDSNAAAMKSALDLLIADVETLTYNNLIIEEGFLEHLLLPENNDVTPDPTNNAVAATPQKGSRRCTIM